MSSIFEQAQSAGVFSRTTTIFNGGRIVWRERNVKHGKKPVVRRYHEIKISPQACDALGIGHKSFVDVDYSTHDDVHTLRIKKSSRGFSVNRREAGKPAQFDIRAKVSPAGDLEWKAPFPDELSLPEQLVDGDVLVLSTHPIATPKAPKAKAKARSKK